MTKTKRSLTSPRLKAEGVYAQNQIKMIEQKFNDVSHDIDDAILNEGMPGFREDYLLLHSLLRRHKPKSVFEIGTNEGVGTKIIKNAVGKDVMVYSLDLPPDLAHISKQHPISEGKGEDKVGWKCKLPFYKLEGNSLSFNYSKYPCDAYFVDGEHTFENVNHESKELIKCNAKLIIYHDADMPCVYDAIVDAFNGNDDYELYRVTDTRIAYALKKKMETPTPPIPKSDNVAIVIVIYNNPNLIKKQAECIKRFCKDAHDIIIIDNSTDRAASEAISYYNQTIGAKYYKTQASSKNGSESHAFACNWAFGTLSPQYRWFFFLDHDNFPCKEFSVKNILQDKVIAGLPQKPKDTKYFWAGCVMFDADKIERGLINFSVSHELQVDTGGMLYRVIEKYGEAQCVFFSEIHEQNPNFTETYYNFYAVINDGFMHFINSSNWNFIDSNAERINSLMAILEEKIKV